MPETEVKYRSRSADVLKGAGIIAIVFIHIMTQAEPRNVANGMTGYPFIFDVTYAGLMMFFLFQGYFYKPHSGYWNNLKKRIIQLVPPFIVCSIVLTLIMAGWGNIYGYYTSTDELIHALALALTNNALEPIEIPSTFYPLVIQAGIFW